MPSRGSVQGRRRLWIGAHPGLRDGTVGPGAAGAKRISGRRNRITKGSAEESTEAGAPARRPVAQSLFVSRDSLFRCNRFPVFVI
jgi:hypothetical protein